MSKMSQLHAELTEQAYELGFESLDEAIANSYEVDYDEGQLVNPYVLSDKAHEEAHKAWLEEKNKVLGGLDLIVLHLDRRDIDKFTIQVRRIIENTIDFIKKGEM